ncbi:F0F1 ATP synthase subunit I [Hahella sp. CR1]|uniref:F0F1 ATP synthase subunit I n=1 Tax=unclassified Hahella TaxID=2624107 RepID=UPI0024415D2A|nr:F0F1 ATP synthase subunit I [Hahella sp. CR1]MDG9666507.1 F0F1 ATP synthase subunit I [Hahella sp. CR1]
MAVECVTSTQYNHLRLKLRVSVVRGRGVTRTRQKRDLNSAARSLIKRPPVFRIVGLQLIATVLISLIAWRWSSVHAYSALVGGLICAVPNMYFAHRAFLYQGAQAARQIVQSIYKAEAVKLGLTAIFFGLAFKFIQPLEPASLFLAFLGVQSVHWFAPLIVGRRQRK